MDRTSPGSLAAACAAALIASATACRPGPTPGTQAASDGPVLRIAVPADVTGIYPHVRDESFTGAVHANAFEGLTRFDRDLRPEPAVAERWMSPNDHTWVFTIRGDLRFSDGQPVRVQDVIASLEQALRHGSTRHALAAIESVEPAGPREVRVRTRTAAPTLLSLLTQALVVPEGALRRPPGRLALPAGTGPYAIESWTPGRALVLRRNTYHAGPPAPYATIRFEVVPSGEERARGLRERRFQVAEGLSGGELDALRDADGVRVVSRPGLRVLFLALRADRKPFDDVRMREAVDLAVDRQVLVARALDGRGTPATQVVPPTVSGFHPGLAATHADQRLARRRLREAGWTGGRLRLYGPTNRYVDGPRILQEVARQLQEVGLEIEVVALDKEKFFSLLGAPELDMYLFGWSCEGADAGNALGSLLHTPAESGLGFENSQGFSDAELDRLIDAADDAPQLDLRRQLLMRALERVAALRPVLPLVVQHESLALGPEVEWDPPVDMSLRLIGARPAPTAAAAR